MKKILTCILFIGCWQGYSLSQPGNKVDTGKYRINLPDYWGRGNKVWQILNDKLPLVCEELKNKELCGDDCRPQYSIEFEMTDPLVTDYYPRHIYSDNSNASNKLPTEIWEFDTYYSFECSLLLFDNTDKLLTRLILVDTNEVFKVTHRATLAAYSAPAPGKYAFRRVSRTETVFVDLNTYNTPSNPAVQSGQTGQTPYSYIEENKYKLYPTRKDLLGIVDGKLRSL